jgi:hypothetical protein
MVQIAASLCGRGAQFNQQSSPSRFLQCQRRAPGVGTIRARMALCAQKNPARRWGAPDKSDQLSRLVARARGRCLAANAVSSPSPVPKCEVSGSAVNQQRQRYRRRRDPKVNWFTFALNQKSFREVT